MNSTGGDPVTTLRQRTAHPRARGPGGRSGHRSLREPEARALHLPGRQGRRRSRLPRAWPAATRGRSWWPTPATDGCCCTPTATGSSLEAPGEARRGALSGARADRRQGQRPRPRSQSPSASSGWTRRASSPGPSSGRTSSGSVVADRLQGGRIRQASYVLDVAARRVLVAEPAGKVIRETPASPGRGRVHRRGRGRIGPNPRRRLGRVAPVDGRRAGRRSSSPSERA